MSHLRKKNINAKRQEQVFEIFSQTNRSVTSQHNYLTRQHKYMKRRHKDLTGRHYFLTSGTCQIFAKILMVSACMHSLINIFLWIWNLLLCYWTNTCVSCRLYNPKFFWYMYIIMHMASLFWNKKIDRNIFKYMTSLLQRNNFLYRYFPTYIAIKLSNYNHLKTYT